MHNLETYDTVVVGGGPSGATAANELATKGRSVLLLDKAGRIKPCGGAIPPRLIRDFQIPDSLLVAKISAARMVSPADAKVDMPIDGGFVGMVDRDVFDEWLRERAEKNGAKRINGTFRNITQLDDGTAMIEFVPKESGRDGEVVRIRARAVIGADGANSAVASQTMPHKEKVPYVFAYHEVIRSPHNDDADFDGRRCDVYYRGSLSPDFYSWVFPHGDTTSVGTGTAHKGYSLKDAVADLRKTSGLEGAETIRREGAPIPLKPRKNWDNGKNVVLAGDAAGVVAPASGEGIYYAMLGGQVAAEAVDEFLETSNAKALSKARKRFMKEHGRVFLILGIMQRFWYSSDKRRERFVSICKDPDVQQLTWQAYMNKKLVRRKPMAHVRIFFKDLAHLFRLVSPTS
ncbi:MAG: geranylgeranyl diphosphate reductase [Alphaproteobacteria bacterium]